MVPGQEQQLEKLLNGALKTGSCQALDDFLLHVDEETTLRCSKQFFTKLDKLINRGLDHKNAKDACVGLTILYKCGKNLSLPGGQGLSDIIAQGLVKKWFEKCTQLWIRGGPQRDPDLLRLAEDFFDSLMVVHGVSEDGAYKVTESLLYPIGQLAADPRIYSLVQKEAVRKLNMILGKIPEQLKKEKQILSSQEASGVTMKLAGHILESGDYDLQTAIMEAVFRMTVCSQRKELANHWFTMEYVANAFSKIQDSEFETDCRKFLNLVNGMQGDRRRVFSFPCLEAFLDKHELLMPSDEKLEEFWIDFNLGSQSISFYFSMADDETQDNEWDTICITENEVKSYSVTEETKRLVLSVDLSEPLCVGVLEGSNITIHFSSSLDILQVVSSIYGRSKNKTFVGKSTTSVVKTTVKIIMDDTCSQATVPESQASLVSDAEKARSSASCWLAPPPAPPPAPMVAPAMRRVSASNTLVMSSRGSSVHSGSPFSVVKPATTPNTGRVKPSLEMISSCEKRHSNHGVLRTFSKAVSHSPSPSCTKTDSKRNQIKDSKQRMKNITENYKRNITIDRVVKMLEDEQEPLGQSFVPDSQPNIGTEKSILSHLNKSSVSEMLIMPSQRNKSLNRPEPLVHLEQHKACHLSVPGSGPISHEQLHAELSQRLQEVIQQRNQTPEPKGLVGPPGIIKSKSREVSRTSLPESQEQPVGKQAPGRCGFEFTVSQEPDPVRVPLKPTPTNTQYGKSTPNSRIKTTGTSSSKEKRDAEVAGSMVKLISSHYKCPSSSNSKDENAPPRWVQPASQRFQFEKSWFPSAKKEESKAKAKPIAFMQSDSNLKKTYRTYGKDIFAFDANTSTSSVGKDKKSTESSVINTSGIRDLWALPSSKKKGQPAAKERSRCVRKHLFSDTDTDCAATDVSWLRESNKKPKPKIVDYSRKASAKTQAPASECTTSDGSRELPPMSPKPVKDKPKPNKENKLRTKEPEEKPEKAVSVNSRAAVTCLRPRRATVTKKNYREPESDSQSESDEPHVVEKLSINGQDKSKRTRQEPVEVKTKKASRLLDNDSQSETEELFVPKKYVTGQQGKSRKICKEVPEVKNKNTVPSSWELDNNSRERNSERENPPAFKHVLGQKEKGETIGQEVINVKKMTTTTESDNEMNNDIQSVTETSPLTTNYLANECIGNKTINSQSEAEQPPALERQVLDQQGKSTKSCIRVANMKKNKTAHTKQSTTTYVKLGNDSQSESEELYPPKQQCTRLQQGKKEKATEMKTTNMSFAKEQTTAETDSWPARLAHFSPSPPPIERMRSAERSDSALVHPCTPVLSPLASPLLVSPIPCHQDPPSPIMELAKPIRLSSSGYGGFPPSFYGHRKRSNLFKVPAHAFSSVVQTPVSRTTNRPSVGGLSPVPTLLSPTALTLLSPQSPQPQLSSTAQELDKFPLLSSPPQLQLSQINRDTFDHNLNYHSVQSEALTSTRVEANPTATMALQLEVTPCDHSNQQQYFVSGPTYKRQSSNPSLSSEEDVKERGMKSKRRGTHKMRPRKLFKSSTEPQDGTPRWGEWNSSEAEERRGSESDEGDLKAGKTSFYNVQKKSTSKMTHRAVMEVSPEGEVAMSKYWEAELEDGEVDMENPDISFDASDMYKNLTYSLQRKVQSRSRWVGLYTNQSLKMAQQHISSFGEQINTYRTQKLQQMRNLLSEEMDSLEQNNTIVKNMEKELTAYWRKQTTTFHSYQEKGTRRLEKLKSLLQNNMCYSLEDEERIFTSQMCLMKKDIKSVQDKLLKEMHEEGIQNVKRGLQSLFLPKAATF